MVPETIVLSIELQALLESCWKLTGGRLKSILDGVGDLGKWGDFWRNNNSGNLLKELRLLRRNAAP